ncbi:hypothetical protein Cgig2_002843 [Carnegiea gigantea]|uniref:Uncharacterized protein n=1 Tax=Carnegiea gigantea TaxID=171969 RepID=A0A9Q1KLI9_9CARY|nr:hypothetical protein Cgig2_002843 [Carnegiea gigantea]
MRSNLSWKFTVDLSVELWELPAKMTELGSSGSYLSWVWRQLNMPRAARYMVLGGLATLTGQVQEMDRMLASLLDKEKSTTSPCTDGHTEHCQGGFLDGTTGLSQGHEYTTKDVVRRHQAPMVVLGMPISPGVVRQRPVPMVVQTWALCDDVQYLWWYELGHYATMSSIYGGTNLGDVQHRPVPMVLEELPQLGITFAGCGGSWTCCGLPVGQPPELGGYTRRETPFEGAPWQGACPTGAYLLAAVGGLAKETCPLGMAVTRWRLVRAVTSGRLVCQDTAIHRDSSRNTSAAQGEDGQQFLLKRCASWDAPVGEKTRLFTC